MTVLDEEEVMDTEVLFIIGLFGGMFLALCATALAVVLITGALMGLASGKGCMHYLGPIMEDIKQ